MLEPAWKVIERRCDAKDIQACFDLAQMYWTGAVTGWWEDTKGMEAFRRGLAIDQEKAHTSQENACNAGKAVACDSLALMYNDGEGVPQDWAKAATLYQKACNAGNANGCNNLGRMYINGKGVAQDKAKAASLYQQACDGGNAWGCDNLGWMLEHGDSAAPDQTRAVQLYQKGCDAGLAGGCTNIGRMYYNGAGVAQDQAKAAVLYQKACDGGSAWGCNNLGWMLEHGESVAPDPTRAVQLYQRGCDAGLGDGCNNLGRMYYNGTGVAQDQAKAAVLYQKACDAGSGWGCSNLGGMLEQGESVAPDQAKAAVLYQKACNNGIALGCSRLAKIQDKGMDVAQAQTKAMPLQQNTCSPGETSGCETVARVPISETPQPAAPPLAPGSQMPPVTSSKTWRPFSLWFEAGYAGASVRESIATANAFSSRGHGFALGMGGRVFEVFSARYNGGMLWYREDHSSSMSTNQGNVSSSVESIYNTFSLGLQAPDLELGADRAFGGSIGLFGGVTTYLAASRDYGECINCSTAFSVKGGFFAEPTLVLFVKVGDKLNEGFAIQRLRLTLSYSLFTPGSDFGKVLSIGLGFEVW
jgi:TPR repeat protein